MADDYTANIHTTGSVAVGGSATGIIEKRNDVDWFAVELVAGQTYVIDLEGGDAEGALGDAMLRGLYDAGGNRIAGTRNHDGGEGADARLTFTAAESGTHYIAARSQGRETGAYTVRVTAFDADATAAGATDLGDLASLGRTRTHQDTVDGGADGTDYYRFTLSEARTVQFTLRRQDADADLYLEDADGAVLHSSTRGGTRNDGIDEMLEAGTYYVRVVAQEEGENAYKLRYRAADPEPEPQPEPEPEPQLKPEPQPEPDPEPEPDPDPQPQQGATQQQVVVPTNVPEPEGQDFSSDTSTQGRVLVGGSVTGKIDNGQDQDWFAVELEAGKTYRIDLKGETTGHGTARDPLLHGIYDANGNFINGTSNDDGGTSLDSRVDFAPGKTGTYYVATATATGSGTYTLSVEHVTPPERQQSAQPQQAALRNVPEPDGQDFSADTSTQGRVLVGGSVTGRASDGSDRDWFAVELKEGKTYQIDLKGTSTGHGTSRDPVLSGIYDADGKLVRGGDDDGGEGTNSRLVFTAAETGTYHVAAAAHDAGTYMLSVYEHGMPQNVPEPDGTDFDFSADTSTQGRVLVGGSVTGTKENFADEDWFAVDLKAGETYRIDLKGTATGDGTMRDPRLLGLYDGNGNLVRGGDDNGGEGSNSRMVVAVGKTDTYYVGASSGTTTGTYTLSVNLENADAGSGTPSEDDFAAGTDTTGKVAVGGSATGEIGAPDDVDWFAVTLENGKDYRIELKGQRTGDGTLADPHLLGIYDADGNYVTGTGSFAATATGTYYVAAGSHGRATGSYTLAVDDVTPEETSPLLQRSAQTSVSEPQGQDFSDNTSTEGQVLVDGSVTGNIHHWSDTDWFAMDLEAGKTYRIDLRGASTGHGTLDDPEMRGIYDSNGRFLTYGDDDEGVGWNSMAFFTPDTDGTYYVSAWGAGPAVGTYTLSVTDVFGTEDDFTADTRTTGTVAVGGSATGEIGAPNDVDWFAVTLEAGKTYRIGMGHNSRLDDGTDLDPRLQGIYDKNGHAVDGAFSDHSLTYFTATEDATYYVAAGTGENRPRYQKGVYEVSVTEIVDDYAGDTGTTGKIAVGGSVQATAETPGDRDWFAVELEAGRDYRFAMEGSLYDGGSLWDRWMRGGLYDADGNRIAGSPLRELNGNEFDPLQFLGRVPNLSGSDAAGCGSGAGHLAGFRYTPTESGTYYVAAGSYEDNIYGTGTYTLLVGEGEDSL